MKPSGTVVYISAWLDVLLPVSMTISVPGLAANAVSACAVATGSRWLVASSRMASLASDR